MIKANCFYDTKMRLVSSFATCTVLIISRKTNFNYSIKTAVLFTSPAGSWHV